MQRKTLIGAGSLAIILIAGGFYLSGRSGNAPGSDKAHAAEAPPNQTTSNDTLELTASQLKAVTVKPVIKRDFSLQRSAVGSIDFNENEAVQVFSSYPGKIIATFADVGQDVKKGQALFAIDSPDLAQAESALLAAKGVYDLTTSALTRAKQLYAVQGIAQKDYEQASSDQMTAEGALKASRQAVRIFGRSDAEIARLEATRKLDATLTVASPVSGRVTARAAQPGLLLQPGNAPAPFAVADMSSKWLMANVTESDSPLLHEGQELDVRVNALPDRKFRATIKVIGATVDPNTHTVLVRAEVQDPRRELRPGMFASYTIKLGESVTGLAVPSDAVVREGDGSMTVWVSTDARHVLKRTVAVGRQQDGYDQITQGLREGELVASEGAVFLSNMSAAGAN